VERLIVVVTPLAAIHHLDRDAVVRELAAHAGRRGFAIAADLLGDRAEAEDVVQEALVRALDGYQRLREPRALESWFYTVLTNLCIRALRRRRVVGAFARLVGARGEPTRDPDELAPDHARLINALDRLPAMQKTAIVLRYGHDLGLHEVAGAMGVGAETVKTHLKRARARLRAELGVDDVALVPR
jgi:RNA polymerase sigma-70 factor (ECF subfamily)